MESEKILSKRKLHSPLICLICGDAARGVNFDVVTCMSCKAFFRRHASRQTPQDLRCPLNDDCIITQQTRGGCTACRLKKCFALGMNPSLIRSPPKKSIHTTNAPKIKTNEQSQSNLPQPTTVSLLRKDRSTISLDEWNVLSNIIHAYDEQNIIIRTQSSIQERSSLPVKLRSKTSKTLDLIRSFYTAIQPFLERSSFFYNLPTDVRQILIQNNLDGTGTYNSLFTVIEAKIVHNELYITSCNEIYGADNVKESVRLMARMETNGTLIKMMLMILAFSSNCSVVFPEHTFTLIKTSTTNSILLAHVQDQFIVILWKYLVYQYGFIEAVRRLDHLVKNYLDVLNRMNENNSKQHSQMVDCIIEKTIHSLTLKDN